METYNDFNTTLQTAYTSTSFSHSKKQMNEWMTREMSHNSRKNIVYKNLSWYLEYLKDQFFGQIFYLSSMYVNDIT